MSRVNVNVQKDMLCPRIHRIFINSPILGIFGIPLSRIYFGYLHKENRIIRFYLILVDVFYL